MGEGAVHSGKKDSTSFYTIEAAFKAAGFCNVRCFPLNDLVTGILDKPNTVAEISVGGDVITSGGRKFSRDANVIISYHSFK